MPVFHQFLNPQRIALSLLLLTVSLSMFITTDGEAKLFDSKRKAKERETVEKLQTYQPPAATSLSTQCDPYRQEVILLKHKPLLFRPLFTPRRLYLMDKHKKCIDRLMDQEYLYLKHVEIQQAPSLPPMALPLDLEKPDGGASTNTVPKQDETRTENNNAPSGDTKETRNK
jgi:hypothetical protein